MSLQPFHLAMPVNDLEKTRQFYGEFLGFAEGRSSEHWIDWDFFGHQFVTHLRSQPTESEKIINHVDGHATDERSEAEIKNEVDGHMVPVPHFGVVLAWQQWHDFADRLKSHNVKFVIEPYIRFKGQAGEQATMFFTDPSGNALEFKAFKDLSKLFAK